MDGLEPSSARIHQDRPTGRGIRYDETDQVMRPTEAQSAHWKARAQNTELFCGASTGPTPGPATLTRHWYLSSFGC